MRSYFWFWQPESDEDWEAPSACPVCRDGLSEHDGGIFRQLLCERDNIVIVGEQGRPS